MTRPTRLVRAYPRPTSGGVDYDNSTSGLDADTVQEAIDELAAGGPDDGVFSVEPQAVQARHYLMRDGTWRDPFIVGEGTVSAGSPATITDDTKYNAWPTLARLTENRVILVYTKADSHHSDNTGKVVCRIGTEDGSGSISWASEVTVYDHSSLWASAMGVARVSTGRVFVTMFRDEFDDDDSGEAGLVYSDDDGATWSSWIALAVGRDAEYGAGPVCEMPDGDLLVTVEGHDVADDPLENDSLTLRSTDNGVTWGGVVTVREYEDDNIPLYESSLLLLDNDVLQIYHRTGASAGSAHLCQESNDFGLTWGEPFEVFEGYGKPNVIQSSTGTLFAITRQTTTADVVLFTSTDRGATWDSGTVLFSTTEMEYGCPLEGLRTGEVYVVYGDQPSGATTNSDIDIVLVTEDLTTSSGGATGAAGGDLAGTYPNPSVVDDSHNHTASTLPAHPAILLESGHAIPFTFDEVLQESDGSDFLYASS